MEKKEVPAELIDALVSFMSSTDLVLDTDWEMTLACATDPLYIAPEGTFLHPGVADESNNWWNRGSFLSAYRELCAQMERAGIYASPDQVDRDME